jgi:UDP-3-O-[3-hydroxymyristoyl] glucosamine N-acyltransferase
MTLREIADRLECTVEGDGGIEITGVSTLGSAKAGELSFLVNPKYHSELKSTRASAIIVGRDFPGSDLTLLRHDNPYLAFARAVEIFHSPAAKPPAIHSTAVIAETALIGKRVSLGPYTYIGENTNIGDDVSVGAHCLIGDGAVVGEASQIHSGSVIREGVTIGRRCVIHDRAVIGSAGFGYAKQHDDTWYRILQAGTVTLEDDVDVGAGTTIDRAALGETRIGKGTKIDNLVQIGHGCEIGHDSLICAQVGLAGSTRVGSNVILAGQVGAAGHLTIGDRAVVTPQSGLPNSVEPGAIVSGSPAMDHRDWLKLAAILPKLSEMKKSLRDIEKRLHSLESSLNA